MSYKRAVLKISGEQLAGKHGSGIDTDLIAWLAGEIKKLKDANVQLAIVVGGGNFARGEQLAGNGIKLTTAHQIGTIATVMNALALKDIFEANGVKSRVLSNLFLEQVVDSFSSRSATNYLEEGVVIVAGGIGKPYFTSDTASVSLALEMSCDVVLKATKVDGVYDSDPEVNPDAIKLDNISAEEAVSNPKIKIMDKAAMGLAYEHKLPIIVFDALKPDNIVRAAKGEQVGTLIQPPK